MKNQCTKYTDFYNIIIDAFQESKKNKKLSLGPIFNFDDKIDFKTIPIDYDSSNSSYKYYFYEKNE